MRKKEFYAASLLLLAAAEGSLLFSSPLESLDSNIEKANYIMSGLAPETPNEAPAAGEPAAAPKSTHVSVILSSNSPCTPTTTVTPTTTTETTLPTTKRWQGKKAAQHPSSLYKKVESCSSVLSELNWNEMHPSSISEAALVGLVRNLALAQAEGVEDSKDVVAQLTLLQDHYHKDLPVAVVTRFARCEVVAGHSVVQSLIRWGDVVAFEHPMARLFWKSWLRGRKPHEVLDSELNNVLHLAVLSSTPGMVAAVLQRMDHSHGSFVAEALLTAGNGEGRTAIQLAESLPSSRQSGIRAQLKRAHRLIAAHNRNLKRHGRRNSIIDDY